MGIDEVTACWQRIRDVAIDDLRTILPAHTDALDLNGEPGPALLGGDGEAHVLVLVAAEDEERVWVLLVPQSKIDAPLAVALKTIDGRTFSAPADLDEHARNAAALVLSAMGLDRDSGDELAAWAIANGATESAATIASYYDRFDGCFARSWDQLAVSVGSVSRWRRTPRFQE